MKVKVLSMDKETILIEIASYCDEELLNTVNSAIIQAEYPDRVHFAICYQGDDLNDYYELQKIKNCKIIHLKKSEAKGSVYARYLCQSLIDDENYIYQIDAHMRFVKHWDTKIINQLLSLNDKKAVLSGYPPAITDEMLNVPLNDKIFDKPGYGTVMYAKEFRTTPSDSYFIACASKLIKKDSSLAYKKNAFIAAGNFFTFSKAHKEVKYDIGMYFYGDELPMSIRLYTYGWNFYNPSESYVYHLYKKKKTEYPGLKKDTMNNENKRFQTLLGLIKDEIIPPEFGLGTVRSVKDYEKAFGIDFKNKIISDLAKSGNFENVKIIK